MPPPFGQPGFSCSKQVALSAAEQLESLDGIRTHVGTVRTGATAWVRSVDPPFGYVYSEVSLAVPDGVNVVRPLDVPLLSPGRWLLISTGSIMSSCPPLSTVLWVDGGTLVPLLLQDGSDCAPFKTIQQALNKIGAPIGAADQARAFAIAVAPGVYPEDLVVPARRRIWITEAFDGEVVIGTLATPRNVTWTSPAGVGTALPLLSIGPTVTGNVILSDGASVTLNVLVVNNVAGNVDATAHVTGIPVLVCRGAFIGGNVIGTTMLMVEAENCVFQGNVTVAELSFGAHSSFKGNVVVTAVPSSFDRLGLFECDFAPGLTWTGPAGSLRVDGATQFSVEQSNLSLLGGATLDRIDDPMTRSVSTAADLTADAPQRDVFVTGALPPIVPGPARTIKLPNTANISPKLDDEFRVKDTTGTASAANPIIVDGNGNNIDGTATKQIATAYGSLFVKFNGTEWSVL